MCDADVRTMMIETAKKNKIPPYEIMTDGGTDAGAFILQEQELRRAVFPYRQDMYIHRLKWQA